MANRSLINNEVGHINSAYQSGDDNIDDDLYCFIEDVAEKVHQVSKDQPPPVQSRILPSPTLASQPSRPSHSMDNEYIAMQDLGDKRKVQNQSRAEANRSAPKSDLPSNLSKEASFTSHEKSLKAQDTASNASGEYEIDDEEYEKMEHKSGGKDDQVEIYDVSGPQEPEVEAASQQEWRSAMPSQSATSSKTSKAPQSAAKAIPDWQISAALRCAKPHTQPSQPSQTTPAVQFPQHFPSGKNDPFNRSSLKSPTTKVESGSRSAATGPQRRNTIHIDAGTGSILQKRREEYLRKTTQARPLPNPGEKKSGANTPIAKNQWSLRRSSQALPMDSSESNRVGPSALPFLGLQEIVTEDSYIDPNDLRPQEDEEDCYIAPSEVG